jgi:hypothetical protein
MRRSSRAAYSTVGTATDGMKAQVVIVDLCGIKASSGAGVEAIAVVERLSGWGRSICWRRAVLPEAAGHVRERHENRSADILRTVLAPRLAH